MEIPSVLLWSHRLEWKIVANIHLQKPRQSCLNQANLQISHCQTSSLEKGPWQASGTLWRQDAVLWNPPLSLWDATKALKLNACMRLKVNSAEGDCETTKILPPTSPPVPTDSFWELSWQYSFPEEVHQAPEGYKRRMGKPLCAHPPSEHLDHQQKSLLDPRVVVSFLLSLLLFYSLSLSLTWFIGT